MALAERTARTMWQGDLMKGSGTVSFTTGAIGDTRVSFPARTESPNGMTSPEELIAAAASSCFAMAFTHTLSQQGHTPDQLQITATCTLDRVDGGLKVTRMNLDVRGRVNGIAEQDFRQLAQAQACPVTNALKGNVEVDIDAGLL